MDIPVWQGLLLVVFLVPWVWACARILRRIGFSGWWAAISFIAPLNLVGLLFLASARWPVDGRARDSSREASDA